MGFSSEAIGGPRTVDPFFLKIRFSTKIYGFSKNCFAQIKELEKLSMTVGFNKRCQVYSRKCFFFSEFSLNWGFSVLLVSNKNPASPCYQCKNLVMSACNRWKSVWEPVLRVFASTILECNSRYYNSQDLEMTTSDQDQYRKCLLEIRKMELVLKCWNSSKSSYYRFLLMIK